MLTNQLNLVQPSLNQKDLDFASIRESSIGLESLAGKRVLFRSDFRREAISLIVEGRPNLPYEVRGFSSVSRDRFVHGIDSSCSLIGETEEGSIFAGRVAVVTASSSRLIRYCRAGPFIFYLNQDSLENGLARGISKRVIRAIVSDNALAERFIRIRLERAAQIHVAQQNSDSLILIDGSIRASLLESRDCALADLERVTEENLNQLLGISKASSLRIVGQTAAALQACRKSSVYVDVTEPLRVLGMGINGRVLVTSFSHCGQVFRVDVSRANAEQDSQVLADTKRNDVMFRGYPETLRLAHHLSVFDSATVSSVRSFLSKRYALVQVPSDDLRATILGKFV
jgi:hypothetical protein